MKNRFVIIGSFVFAAMLFTQCGKDCAREECPNEIPASIVLRLVNSADLDLLAGPAKMYDTTQVRIRARRISSGSVEEIKRSFIVLKNNTGTADSTISTGFTVNNQFAAYYLVLNNVTTDSLVFGYNNRKTLCCDLSSYYLDRVNTNDIQDISLPTTFIIRK